MGALGITEFGEVELGKCENFTLIVRGEEGFD